MSASIDVALLAALESFIDARIDAKLAQGTTSSEYCSRGPRPLHTSKRTFNENAAEMIDAGVPGARVEGKGTRDRVYFVERVAWHRWRTSRRSVARPVEPSDEDLADAALVGAELRVVQGGRR